MGERVAIVSANFGNFDQVRTQAKQDIDVDWIIFSDDPHLNPPKPWKLIVNEDRGAHPNMAAKRFKLLPDVSHRYVIWIDANMEVTSRSFAREALGFIHDGIALHKHPRRDCIYDEAEASLGAESQNGKYEGLGIEEQVARYWDEGHPKNAGLYACGTIAWDRGDPKARRLGLEWLGECARWTYQDQLSFPVVCRRLGIQPGVFPFSQIERRAPVLSNRWLKIHPHL